MALNSAAKQYLTITLSYWAFTLTDGALRMLVLFFFHGLGYSPLELASLFILYEFFGILTNLYGGWLATRIGLNVLLYIGLGLQILALGMLTVEILSAIGGSESTMKIYELAAIGQTFEEAFANVYGISWAEAKPILADLTASLHEDVYM